ncbi:hypothetical protein C7271_02895 [filamentous cyanobacterium CCP5]|nr:hypothetical protein C7271_02895 [filamentous cyanobacterium CCP5]
MHIRYFATNRDRENLGLDVDRETRIKLQKGGYNWINTQQYMSYYLATTDPNRMPAQALIKDSQKTVFDEFLNSPAIKRILIGVHGFNVSLHGALTSFSILADTLAAETVLGDTLIVDPIPDNLEKRKKVQAQLQDPHANLTAFVGFSWPSNGSVFDYRSDRSEAISSASALANLISVIRQQKPNAAIHIIAHSMGNYLTCTMLSKLVNKDIFPLRQTEQILQQLERRDHGGDRNFFVDGYIMLAPDVERRHVTQCDKHDDPQKSYYLGPFYAGLYHLVGGVYLFYSRHDTALQASIVEKEAHERVNAIREVFTGPNLDNRWEDSLGRNPAPSLAPVNMYSYNASTLGKRPIDHGDYFDTAEIVQKIAEVILQYK